MPNIPQKPIHTTEDAMVLLDSLITKKTDWEPFYTQDKHKPPILRNIPDENLVEYFQKGWLQSGRAIDLGCGIGRNAIFMANQGCDVDAIDLSETAISKAKTLAQKENLTINFMARSVFEIQLPSNHFDIVYDCGLLHSLPPHRRPSYLDLVYKILKPQGHFGLSCFSPDIAPSPADWVVYESGKMSSGIGYTEARLRAILKPFFDILVFRPMKATDNTEMLGLEGLWAVLMKPLPHTKHQTNLSC